MSVHCNLVAPIRESRRWRVRKRELNKSSAAAAAVAAASTFGRALKSYVHNYSCNLFHFGASERRLRAENRWRN